jgi:hypothetical protein
MDEHQILASLPGDPTVDLLLEHFERDRAHLQDDVVELAKVEAATELLLGARAQLLDLQLADLVGQRLARPADVAIGLVGDIELGLAAFSMK